MDSTSELNYVKGSVPMEKLPPCPQCGSELTYLDRELFACPECAFEWSANESIAESPAEPDRTIVKDAHGNLLSDGDSVVMIKDLKVKGASQPLKVGTKVRSIRLVEGDHNIDCHIEGFGAMKLKSEFVKKA